MAPLSRRAILSGLIAAPAVVAVGNIMPVRLWNDPLVPVVFEMSRGEHMLAYNDPMFDYALKNNPQIFTWMTREDFKTLIAPATRVYRSDAEWLEAQYQKGFLSKNNFGEKYERSEDGRTIRVLSRYVDGALVETVAVPQWTS